MDIDSELDAGEREQNPPVRLVFFFSVAFWFTKHVVNNAKY